MNRVRKILDGRLVKNFGYLSIFNLINLISPLIVVPFLIKKLGMLQYGEIVYAQSISMYFSILVSFGFNQIALRDVVLANGNIIKLSRVISSVYIGKGILLIFSLITIVLISLFFDLNSKFTFLLVFSMWPAFQEFIVPEWYFQGVERMKSITIVNALSKICSTLIIFLFVNEVNDYLIVPLSYCIGLVVAAVFIYFELVYKDRIRYRKVTILYLIRIYKESVPIFISRLSQLYIRLNKVLIGAFIGSFEVALFDIGEKVMNLLKIPITIFGQIYFPTLVKNGVDVRFFQLFKLFILLHFGAILLVGITVHIVLSEPLSLGRNEVDVTKIMFFFPLLLTLIPVTINVFFGNLYLFGIGAKRNYSITTIAAGMAYLIGILMMYIFNKWSINNFSIVILLSEFTCTIITLYFFKKNENSRYRLW